MRQKVTRKELELLVHPWSFYQETDEDVYRVKNFKHGVTLATLPIALSALSSSENETAEQVVEPSSDLHGWGSFIAERVFGSDDVVLIYFSGHGVIRDEVEPRKRSYQQQYNYWSEVSNSLQILIDNSIDYMSVKSKDYEALPAWIRLSLESIVEHIRALKNRVGTFLLSFVSLLARWKYKKHKLGIGKGVEGYIPFHTWARGSLDSQLVNQLLVIDKLSRRNTDSLEFSYGC